MIGIVVPAHDEAAEIVECLTCIQRCAQHPRLQGEVVEVVVVADVCTDETLSLAAQQGAVTLEIHARNVGRARAAGAQLMLDKGARWLAFTDADTLVSEGWLVEQIALEADAVCGTVAVEDWTPHGEHADLVRWHFRQTYKTSTNIGTCTAPIWASAPWRTDARVVSRTLRAARM